MQLWTLQRSSSWKYTFRQKSAGFEAICLWKGSFYSSFAVHTWLRCEFLWGLQDPSQLIRCKASPSFTEYPALRTSGKVLLFWRHTFVPPLFARASCFAWSHTQKLNCCRSHLWVKAKLSFLAAPAWIPHCCKAVMNLSRTVAVLSQIIWIL